MARGRKSQPAETKEAKGNPGKRRNQAVSTDELPALEGRAPAELTADGKRIWNALAPQLKTTRLLRTSDHHAFARYCDTLAEYWKVTRALRKRKSVYDAATTSGGTMRRIEPLFMIQERLAKRLDAAEDRFGLNPRARQEIMYRLAQSPQPSPLPLEGGGEPDAPASEPAGPRAAGFLRDGHDGSKLH